MAEIVGLATGEEHFTDLFLHAAGISEVPRSFIFWTAMSMLAACVENRIWMARFAYKRIYPNLYTFLIGGSASGKGHAIDIGKMVAEIMRRAQYSLPIYEGKITRAALYDEMAERWEILCRTWSHNGFRGEPPSCPMFLICPELSNNISTGDLSRDFIKTITDWWECKSGQEVERTRGNGKHTFNTPVLNILAGTTPDWCREVISLNDLASGFWARVMCVYGERDPRVRIYRPDTSSWETTSPFLAWRLTLLMGASSPHDFELTGEMRLSAEAEHLDEEWYMTRPEVENSLVEAHWKRQHDQIWKIAMLLRLGDFFDLEAPGSRESWRVIGPEHIERAQVLSNELMRNAEDFATRSIAKNIHGPHMRVEDIVRISRRIIQKPDLLNKVSTYGVKSKELERILQDLEDEGKIERILLSASRWEVVWRYQNGSY